MGGFAKLGMLLRIAVQSPFEFLDRVEAIITSRIEEHCGGSGEYQTQTIDQVLTAMQQVLKVSIDWTGVAEIEQEVRKRMYELEEKAPFTTKHHGDISLARLCYVVCRLLRPEIVVETGVAYGVTTAFILRALHVNQNGKLFSIDLPPLGRNVDAFIGFLVPEELKDNWTLYRGTSKRILPKLLPQLGQIDMFVHDSLHTYWNMRRELTMVTPYLARPSVVIADDIQKNRAFAKWVLDVKPTYATALKQEGKPALAGVAIFG